MSKPQRTPVAGTPGVLPQPESRPSSFDPWKFGKVAIPPALRQELAGTELPVIPPERLYGSSAPEPIKVPARPPAGQNASLLAATAVLALFGAAMLGWAVLGSALGVKDASQSVEGSP